MELETKVFWIVHKYAKLYNYEDPGESQGFFGFVLRFVQLIG